MFYIGWCRHLGDASSLLPTLIQQVDYYAILTLVSRDYKSMHDRADIEWAPRVSLAKIRALYVREASGICDDALVDEVGFSLLWRCESIIEFTEAVKGWVKCKRCARSGTTTFIERKLKKPSEILRCPTCAWQVRWRVYVAEANKKGGRLEAGHALEAFQRYAGTFPGCSTPKERILAIDRLIHDFHWILLEEGKNPEPFKPAGLNLLQGSTTQVLELLEELAYGDNPAPELKAVQEWWQSQKPIARRQGR